MIDRDVVIEKINSIQNCLKRIHDTVKGNFEHLHQLDTQDIVVLNLQRAIQLTIDMAAYIVSMERLGIPKSLKDLFQILEQNQYISSDLSEKMQKMVGFRNIAVHDYQAIDPKILASILSHHLVDFETFYSVILRKVTN
jgi:uncharacterized protein YutE (UPF0331/DUF86 family)